MAYHVHCHRDDIHIAGSLSVAEQGSFDSVCTCQHTQLRIGDTASSVVVGMHAEHHIFPVFQVLVEIFHLGSEDMRHCNLDRSGNIDNRFILFYGLPHIQHRIAHIQRIVHFCSREALRAVFKGKVTVCFICQLF